MRSYIHGFAPTRNANPGLPVIRDQSAQGIMPMRAGERFSYGMVMGSPKIYSMRYTHKM